VEIDGEYKNSMAEEEAKGLRSDLDDESNDAVDNGLNALLQLPRIPVPITSKPGMQAKIDYQKSHLLTQEDHVQHLEGLATRRNAAA